jgi:hypothetical protein
MRVYVRARVCERAAALVVDPFIHLFIFVESLWVLSGGSMGASWPVYPCQPAASLHGPRERSERCAFPEEVTRGAACEYWILAAP